MCYCDIIVVGILRISKPSVGTSAPAIIDVVLRAVVAVNNERVPAVIGVGAANQNRHSLFDGIGNQRAVGKRGDVV